VCKKQNKKVHYYSLNHILTLIHWYWKTLIQCFHQKTGHPDVIKQMDLTDTYRACHPNTKEYTFFLAPHRASFKIDNILRHKANLNKYNRIEMTPCILSDHHRLKPYINNRKLTHSWKLNKSLLNKKCVREKN
jgi:exonuclease III